MNRGPAADYINASDWNQWRPGLERTSELLRRLGDPQARLTFVHAAGTNGKGSFCAMLESVLRAAGYTAGLYSSPFITDMREQIRVNGEWIPEEAMERLTGQIREAADAMEDHPSQFEMLTALAMLYFAERQCDIVVMECGMGGLKDATNVIGTPELAVITRIGIDHRDYLGDTLAEIAEAKAGIIKPGTRVVCYPNEPEAMEPVRRACRETGSTLVTADSGRIRLQEQDLSGQRFLWQEESGEEQTPEFRIPLAGSFQLQNAALVLTAVQELRDRGWKISREAVKSGLAQVSWPARFEILRQDPLFILDGGHNLQCAEAVAESLRELVPGERPVLLTGMLADKEVDAVLDVILPTVSTCICCAPPNSRALPAEELAEKIRKKGWPAEAAENTEKAVEQVLAADSPVLAFGSLYLAGEIRKILAALT